MRSKVPLPVALTFSEPLPVDGPKDLALMPLENEECIINAHILVSHVICTV